MEKKDIANAYEEFLVLAELFCTCEDCGEYLLLEATVTDRDSGGRAERP